MITIIHGEDTTLSYKRLSDVIRDTKNQFPEILIKEAQELDATILRQETSSTGLFGVEKVIIIKNLLSGSKAKQKEALIDIVKKTENAEIILYENKKLSDTILKTFPKAKVEAFNINPVIFKFLELLRPSNSRQILTGWNRLLELGHEPEYIFTMVVRQIRLLIQAKSGPSYMKLAPYPKKMLTSQAMYFNLSQLLDLHYRLYEIDKKIKTGITPLPLSQLMIQFFLKI